MTLEQKLAVAGFCVAAGYPLAKIAANWVIKTYLYWAKVDAHEEEIREIRKLGKS